MLEARGLSKSFGGIAANRNIDFAVQEGELRGIIGPNGAGKSTFFKMLTCELAPSAGHVLFHGRDITGMNVAAVCQLGLTKSYQVNQLFARLTVRQNVVIAALAERRGIFTLDLLRRIDRVPGLPMQVESTLALVGLAARADMPVAALAYGEKRRLEIGLALAASPSLLLLDEPLAGMSRRNAPKPCNCCGASAAAGRSSSSSTTWTRCSNWPSASPCCTKGRCWPRARRARCSATAWCRKPISAGSRRHDGAA